MPCDMHCNMMQRREHVHETRRDEHKSAQASSGQRTTALAYCDGVHFFNCAHGSHAARMDDYDESERSLSSSTVLPLSLLGWYGPDLSLKNSRCLVLSCLFSLSLFLCLLSLSLSLPVSV